MRTTAPWGESSVLNVLNVPAARSASSSAAAVWCSSSFMRQPELSRPPGRRASRSDGARSCRPALRRAMRRRSRSPRAAAGAVMSGRRSTTPCSSSQRVRYQVAKISRPLTAETVRFLKISASATSSSTGWPGMPNSTTCPPFRTIRKASRTASAHRTSRRRRRGARLRSRPSEARVRYRRRSRPVLDRAHAGSELEAVGDDIRGEHSPGTERACEGNREQADGPAAQDADGLAGEVGVLDREDGVAERLLEGGDLGGQLVAVVLPEHRLGYGDVLCEAAVAVDAEDPRAFAHVGAAGAAVEAAAAGDVALGGDEVALLGVANGAARLDDGARELVAERDRRRDAVPRPVVPAIDVQVGAADARGLDPDEHLVLGGTGTGTSTSSRPGAGPSLRSAHIVSMAGRSGRGVVPASAPARKSLWESHRGGAGAARRSNSRARPAPWGGEWALPPASRGRGYRGNAHASVPDVCRCAAARAGVATRLRRRLAARRARAGDRGTRRSRPRRGSRARGSPTSRGSPRASPAESRSARSSSG